MEVIAIDSKALKEITDKLDRIENYIHSVSMPDIENMWIDNYDVCSIQQPIKM